MANPKIQLRHDTSANWSSANPTLLEGEFAYETDTKKIKVGDGTTAYTSLEYFEGIPELPENVTTQGNTFNGANQLVQLDASGKLPDDIIPLDKLNQSKALETGSVSSDPDVYSDIVNYAHSTFDRSKFEVVESPNITNDGIASGFSNGKVETPIKVGELSKNTFKISCSFVHSEGQGVLFSSVLPGNTELGISVIVNINRMVFYCSSNGTSWDIANFINGITIIDPNVNYNFTLEFTGTNYIGTLINLDTMTEIQEFSVESSNKVFEGNNKIFFGGQSYWPPLKGSIDLKSIAIWGDGVPVFNGNKTGTDTVDEIQIPYVLSKTGSKIVDAAYRDRVQDVYDQYGISQYYTLDEENQNFTLPMGEIYGMIEQKANTTHTHTYSDITSGYSQIAGLAMPSMNYVDLTWPESTQNIQGLPNQDGYLYLEKNATAVGQTCMIRILDASENFLYRLRFVAKTATDACTYFIPLSAGCKVSLTYSLDGDTSYLRFFPCKGFGVVQ